MTKIRVGVAGAAGYTGGELIRLLLGHPYVEISWLHSSSNGGKPVYAVHDDLIGYTDLAFSTEANADNIDVVFLCLGHGTSAKYLADNPALLKKKIIDLSQDFRLTGTHDFVYGLPEFQRDVIAKANHIANPGCFATAIQLALLPLAAHGLLTNHVHINATTGSTGAGQALSETGHFSWREGNFSVYKAFTHQHLAEIGQTLTSLQNNRSGGLYFIPNRGNFTRGIFVSLYLQCSLPEDEAIELYENFYASHPFTHVTKSNLHLKQVVNTNNCLLQIEKHGEQLLILSAIDNLLKGASGQALENMNLLFGLEQTAGLRIKPSAF